MALCLLGSKAWGFTFQAPKTPSLITLKTTAPSDITMFPTDLKFDRMDGDQSVRTYQMPENAERVQMVLKTNGRPLKARIEMWIGPIRRVHFVDLDIEDGLIFPYHETLKFKKGPQVVKIMTESMAFPLEVSVTSPSPQRTAELDAITQSVWDASPKTLIQGGSTLGGHGAVRSFPLENNVESVQVIIWSKYTSKKSFKAMIEVLQGPNNKKQVYDMQCSGGSQPYHAILQTPGTGNTIRIYNKKFVEDGLFECVVVPYKIGDYPSAVVNKPWWEK